MLLALLVQAILMFYIPNAWGYKRLFLNPVIFNFYGHLGGFRSVKNVVSMTRDKMDLHQVFQEL